MFFVYVSTPSVYKKRRAKQLSVPINLILLTDTSLTHDLPSVAFQWQRYGFLLIYSRPHCKRRSYSNKELINILHLEIGKIDCSNTL